MNHKRRRPKKQRAGCLMCKWWKRNGVDDRKNQKHSDYMRWRTAKEKQDEEGL